MEPYLNIEDKEDLPAQTQAVEGLPSRFVYTAAEWNLIRDKINALAILFKEPLYTEDTNNIITLSKSGNYCNIENPNTNTAFLTTGEGWSRTKISTAGKTEFPTVATAYPLPSDDFETDVLFDMWVDNRSGVLEYFFTAR